MTKDLRLSFWLTCLQITTGMTLGVGLAVVSRLQKQYLVIGEDVLPVIPEFDLISGILCALLLILFVILIHCLIQSDRELLNK